MVQAMEAWFVADLDALEEYFGQGFNRNPIPGTNDVESIAQGSLEAILNQAARNSKKKGYHKIRDGSELLKRIDRGVVRQKAPHCELLFLSLMAAIDA